MIRPICRDVLFLSRKAETATKADAQVAVDLLDTLRAHADSCVGMAANMIGINKRVIAVSMGPVNVVLFNPVIVSASGAFETEEGCLSLTGVRSCTRFQRIEVEYQDLSWQKQRSVFSGWTAQIIQHEIDHTNGIVI